MKFLDDCQNAKYCVTCGTELFAVSNSHVTSEWLAKIMQGSIDKNIYTRAYIFLTWIDTDVLSSLWKSDEGYSYIFLKQNQVYNFLSNIGIQNIPQVINGKDMTCIGYTDKYNVYATSNTNTDVIIKS